MLVIYIARLGLDQHAKALKKVTVMKVHYGRHAIQLHVLHRVKALSGLFALSSRLVREQRHALSPFRAEKTAINFECATGGHGRCVNDACECHCHRRNTV